ncbi:hypothetical protein ACFQU7_15465 [Pseudoroseomonas wenyumeiae]
MLAESLALLLQRASGLGDQLQRRGMQALTVALNGCGAPGITIPAVALGAPTLVGHLLRHGGAALPREQTPGPAVDQLAAFASGFTHIAATGAHLAELLRAGDQDGIAAIGAFVTRRYGQPFLRPERPGIVTVLSTGNVGDTLLYLAGFAAFTRASGQPVHVLHRASRTALTEFFGAVPGLSFEPIPNDMAVPAPLALNRLAPGNVSLFYENPGSAPRNCPGWLTGPWPATSLGEAGGGDALRRRAAAGALRAGAPAHRPAAILERGRPPALRGTGAEAGAHGLPVAAGQYALFPHLQPLQPFPRHVAGSHRAVPGGGLHGGHERHQQQRHRKPLRRSGRAGPGPGPAGTAGLRG